MKAEDLVGVWRLLDFVVEHGAQRLKPFGERPTGRLHLSVEGELLVTILAEDRPRLASDDPQACSAQEALGAFRSAAGYFGRWRFDAAEQALVTEVEGSLFPNWEGTSQVRLVALDEGGRLTLTTPPLSWEGGRRCAALTWERSPGGSSQGYPRMTQ